MNELLESFIKHLSDEKNYSEHTIKAYSDDLENFCDFPLKKKKIENTDVTTINAYVSTLYGEILPLRLKKVSGN